MLAAISTSSLSVSERKLRVEVDFGGGGFHVVSVDAH